MKSDDLLTIGAIAASFGISSNNIRRMEAAGLLTPAHKSKDSRYRYYDRENLGRILLILYLKDLGFVNDEIREHLKHPGDFTALNESLLKKQRALSIKIEKMGKRLKSKQLYSCEIADCPGTYCMTKTVRMVPGLESLSKNIGDILFEAIEKQYPVDYTRSLLIVSDCADYRKYRRDAEQDIMFCIPLRHKVKGEDIKYMPSCRMLSVTWNYPMNDYPALIRVIDNTLEINGYRQAGPVRIAYDVGSYMGKDIGIEDTVLHLLLPIE